ncbi:MAG: DUF4342 domain-containing protein [Firmicutes bacterium]|nr:DUF4342 domain-containing protein [Bacillota bacterium]
MEITLSKIDLIRERTGLNYKEAKQLLEEANGDVVEALVNFEAEEGVLEGKRPGMNLGMKGMKNMVSDNVITPIKHFFSQGTRTQIRVRNAEGTLLEIPAFLGIAGAILAPRVTAFTTMALLMARYNLEVDTPYTGVEYENEWT